MNHCRFGFYQSIARYAYTQPEDCRRLWTDQVQRGFETSTVYTYACEVYDPHDTIHGFALMIDDLLEVGLIRGDFPVLALGLTVPELLRTLTYRNREWPELVYANKDDPSQADYDEVKRHSDEAHEAGLRTGTAISGFNLGDPVADLLDLWIVEAATWRPETRNRAAGTGKELWGGTMYDFSHDPLRARVVSGIWAWSMGVPCCLWWAFTHSHKTRALPNGSLENGRDGEGWMYSYAYPRPDSPPVATPGYEALCQGMADCRALEWAEAEGDGESRAFAEEVRAIYPDRMGAPTEDLPGIGWRAIWERMARLREVHRDAVRG